MPNATTFSVLVGYSVAVINPMAFRLIPGHPEFQIGVFMCNVRKPRPLVFLFLSGTPEINELPAFFNPVTDDQFFGPIGLAETALADDELGRRVI